jgi:hypothetical protein
LGNRSEEQQQIGPCSVENFAYYTGFCRHHLRISSCLIPSPLSHLADARPFSIWYSRQKVRPLSGSWNFYKMKRPPSTYSADQNLRSQNVPLLSGHPPGRTKRTSLTIFVHLWVSTAITMPRYDSSSTPSQSGHGKPPTHTSASKRPREKKTFWYCCNCPSGPMLLTNNPTCPECYHKFCGRCPVEKR